MNGIYNVNLVHLQTKMDTVYEIQVLVCMIHVSIYMFVQHEANAEGFCEGMS